MFLKLMSTKEPAYKRLGIEISNTQSNNTNSRISVGTDSNNDLQLRSNNSFCMTT
jgi:cell division protein FtsZ